jgi:hypothetical protein
MSQVGVYLFGIPLPPSSNHQYATIIRRGRPIRIPSKETKDYEKIFKAWLIKNKEAITGAKEDIVQWNKPLSISMVVAFSRERLVTKDGRLKRLDVSNRTKALHDLISDALGIDDCLFVSCPTEKVVADTYGEQVVVCIRPTELRSLSKVDIESI